MGWGGSEGKNDKMAIFGAILIIAVGTGAAMLSGGDDDVARPGATPTMAYYTPPPAMPPLSVGVAASIFGGDGGGSEPGPPAADPSSPPLVARIVSSKLPTTTGTSSSKMVGPAAIMTGSMPGVTPAHTFNDVASNMTDSMAELPALLSGLAYLLAMLLGTQGILRIRDHVENPEQFPVRLGTLRLMAGAALFALPIVYESMYHTVGETTTTVAAAQVNVVASNLTP